MDKKMTSTGIDTAIDWYRTPVSRDVLTKLNRKSDLKGLLQATGHLCLIIVTGSLSVFVTYSYSWWVLIPTLFLHGTVCAFLVNACHELVHGTVFNSRKLNNLFLHVFSFIRWFPPEYYWRIHVEHHKHTLYPSHDRDPELYPYQDKPGVVTKFSFNKFLTTQIFNPFNLVSTIKRNLQHSRGIIKNEWESGILSGNKSRQKVTNWARVLLTGHLAIATVSIYFENWIILVVVSMTPCYGGWLQYLCNHPQHAGLKTNAPDFRLNSRTNYLNGILQFLYWHMNFHIEHHMYTAVPCYNLGKLHIALKHDLPPTLNGLGPVWRQIFDIQHRQLEKPDYCFVQKLPGQDNMQR